MQVTYNKLAASDNAGGQEDRLASRAPPAYWNLHLHLSSHQAFHSKMDDLLTAVKTVRQDPEFSLTPVTTAQSEDVSSKHDFDLDNLSARHIIDLLKSNPDHDEVFAALTALDPFSKSKATKDFDLRIASPVTAQILHVLVSTTIPDHWRSLDAKDSKGKGAKARAALLRCLSNITGLGALVAQVRHLINTARASAQEAQGSSTQLVIQDLLAVLAALLEPKEFLLRLSTDISAVSGNKVRQQITWRELVSLVAASKILSTAAEALTVVDESSSLSSISWVGTGSQYASWLGRNISHMTLKLAPNNESDCASVALLTGRALSLGYTGKLGMMTSMWTQTNTGQINWSKRFIRVCFSSNARRSLLASSSTISNRQSSLHFQKQSSVMFSGSTFQTICPARWISQLPLRRPSREWQLCAPFSFLIDPTWKAMLWNGSQNRKAVQLAR